jgi:hypothetical protein
VCTIGDHTAGARLESHNTFAVQSLLYLFFDLSKSASLLQSILGLSRLISSSSLVEDSSRGALERIGRNAKEELQQRSITKQTKYSHKNKRGYEHELSFNALVCLRQPAHFHLVCQLLA